MVLLRVTKTPILEPRPKCALIWENERVSYAQVLWRARNWARHMPEPGKRVVIFSENGPGWVYAAYAIWAGGAVLVPIDHLSSAEELAYVVDDCEPALILCSHHNRAAVERGLKIAQHQPRILVLEELALDELSMGDSTDAQSLAVDESALATIVYTSGTTGNPKGVMLTFGNILANVRPVVNEGYFTETARVLLLLPLHHVLPLAGCLVAPLFAGATIVFAPSLAGEALLATLRQNAVTGIVGVPRVYDLLHRALRERIQSNIVARTLFALARRLRSRVFSRFVFSSVHRKFGGALEYLICGGAALSPETGETFDVLGFHMCEGFGMTECSPMITFPRLHHIKIGSCGQVLDGCEARIGEGGEIMARGPNVMLGYYNRPLETSAILRDGWLHTGDLGRFDEQGYLYVTGRLKEILVLASGKKVNPATVEEALVVGATAVHEAGVYLDGDVLHALLVPNWEQLPIADRRTAETWLRHEVLDRYNATVAPYRRVARLTLVSDELPRTRLGKLRRHLLPGIAERTANHSTELASAKSASEGALGRLIVFLERQLGRPVKPSSRLDADLGLDSLGRVELSVFIERAFGIAIPEARLSAVVTVMDLACFADQFKSDDGNALIEVSWAEILHPKTLPLLPRSGLLHRCLMFMSRIIIRVLFRVAGHGCQELPAGACILAVNHQSFLDGLFVCAQLNPRDVLRTFFYAKEQHVRKPWVRALARRCNTVVVNPKEGFLGSLQQLATGLQQGNNLIIFPEGTRSRDGHLGPFKDSYAILASELRCPVVPVVIEGAYAALPAGRRFPNFTRRITVTCLEAMQPAAGELAASFNARVRARISNSLERVR